MKVKIDKDLCTGCGLCADTCPEVFVMNGDVAEVKSGVEASSYSNKIKEAAENCPTEAIKIEE